MSARTIAPVLLALAAFVARAPAQSQYQPGDDGKLKETAAPPESSPDEQVIARARRALADRQPGAAREALAPWLEENERTRKPEVPEALLLRGDASLALDEETSALYDYEKLIKRFPQSEQFVTALERETDIAVQYTHGRRKRFLGMRIEDAGDLGVEMLIRVQERLPGSALAERAAVEMADYYFREREMSLAAESYDLYLMNYPNGPHRMVAMERRIYASIGRFRGPEHDSSGLLDAREQIRGFAMQYPDEAERQGLDSALVSRLDESAALQRLDTAKWYLRTGDRPSARLTLLRLIAKNPQTAAAREARVVLEREGWPAPPPTSRTPPAKPEPATPTDTPAPAPETTGAGR